MLLRWIPESDKLNDDSNNDFSYSTSYVTLAIDPCVIGKVELKLIFTYVEIGIMYVKGKHVFCHPAVLAVLVELGSSGDMDLQQKGLMCGARDAG